MSGGKRKGRERNRRTELGTSSHPPPPPSKKKKKRKKKRRERSRRIELGTSTPPPHTPPATPTFQLCHATPHPCHPRIPTSALHIFEGVGVGFIVCCRVLRRDVTHYVWFQSVCSYKAEPASFPLLPANYKQTLLKHIDADQLPVHWGGSQRDPDGNPFCASKVCV